jgi:hypothetical protein
MNETREYLEDEITRLNERVMYLENELENSSKNHDLIKKERMYRLLADSCPDVIYRISIPKGRYEYISHPALGGAAGLRKSFIRNLFSLGRCSTLIGRIASMKNGSNNSLKILSHRLSTRSSTALEM